MFRNGGRGKGASGNSLHTGRGKGFGGGGKGKGFGGGGGKGFGGGGKGKGFGGGGGKGGGKGKERFGGGRDVPWTPPVPLAERNAEVDRIDGLFGYEKLDKTATSGTEHVGWMTNFRTVMVEEQDGAQLSAVEYYFIAPDGTGFKALQRAQPYFYLSVQPGAENEVEAALRRNFAAEVRPRAYPLGHTRPAPTHPPARPQTLARPVGAAQGHRAEECGGPHAAQPPLRPAQAVPAGGAPAGRRRYSPEHGLLP